MLVRRKMPNLVTILFWVYPCFEDLQPKEIEEFFAEVIFQADELQQAYNAARRPQHLRVPSVTVS